MKCCTQVKKRNGNIVSFDSAKITNAINKSISNILMHEDILLAQQITNKVLKQLYTKFGEKQIPSVEKIQDIVEEQLISDEYREIAKAYILYRHEREKIRDEKLQIINKKILDPVSMNFDVKSIQVLASRYLLRNNKSEIIETPTEMFIRVSTLVSIGDLLYDEQIYDKDGNNSYDNVAEEYLNKLNNFDNKFKIGKYYLNKYHFRSLVNHYINLSKDGKMKITFKELLTKLASNELSKYEDNINNYNTLMTAQIFLPNSPTMMNAGCRLGQLSACFVLDMPDDMSGIMQTTADAALIFQSGGGVGINYSELRPEGSIVASTSGVASGPVSFMDIINTVTEVVKQGGKRRGANMGIMDVSHPDIEKFITNKTEPGVLENFNVSVGIWSDFWNSFISGNNKCQLKNKNGEIINEVDPKQLIDLIAISAWKSAEPGLIFFDIINKYNVFQKARGQPLQATNPCGEQSLYPYESCNLGSINLSKLTTINIDGKIVFDWAKYEQTIRITTRFLDNIIDVNKYPIEKIKKASIESRRIGLGVMGVADLLYKLGIKYNSKDGYKLQSKLAETLSFISMDESVELSRERNAFTLFSKTEYVDGKLPIAGYYTNVKKMHDWVGLIDRIKKYGIRNVLTTTVAPTGTLSMIAECSNGIEPTFALVFEKHVTVGKFYYTNNVLEQMLKEQKLNTNDILEKIKNNYGSVQGIDEITKDLQDIFITAMDLHWSDHLFAQSVWQDWIGNAIAKTINMPFNSTVEDVKASYILAHELGLKGITVYRDGSRHSQVLHMTSDSKEKNFESTPSDTICEYIDTMPNNFIKTNIHNAINNENTVNNTQINTKINNCPNCNSVLILSEGCTICIECGFSGCSA